MSVNSVQILRKTNFSSLSLERKLEIKNVGRPIPNIDITRQTKSNSKEIVRKFRIDIYKRTEWICGCEITNRLFCFPCLCFVSDEREGTWTEVGVVDLGHLSQKVKKHESSKSHMLAQLEFDLLG